MELMMNEQGVFEKYDDTYDVVIHCDSKEARDKVLADLKAVNERLLDKIRAEIKEHADRLKDSLYGDGMRHCIEIIDKYRESEDK